MIDALYTWQVVVPAGTLAAAPLTQSLLLPPSLLAELRVRIPPGPRGHVGWQVWYGGGQAFPRTAGTWLIADDVTVAIGPSASMSSGAWSLRAYNVGQYQHTLYVEGDVRAVTKAATRGAEPAPLFIP